MEKTVTAYRIWDRITQNWASAEYKPTRTNWKRARTRADKMDLAYGGYRYSVREVTA